MSKENVSTKDLTTSEILEKDTKLHFVEFLYFYANLYNMYALYTLNPPSYSPLKEKEKLDFTP